VSAAAGYTSQLLALAVGRDQVSYSSKIPTDKFALRFVKP